jgi:putative transposase
MRTAGLVGCHRRRRRGLTRRDPAATPRRTWWGGCSTRERRTGPGSPTSPTSPPGKGGCTWPQSWTAAPARWSAEQYTAGVYAKALEAAGARQSMGRVATCFDNAVAESFFATLKTELVHARAWPTRQAARTAIYEYVEVFYNRRRRHSALDYLSPAEYERRHHQQQAGTLVAA